MELVSPTGAVPLSEVSVLDGRPWWLSSEWEIFSEVLVLCSRNHFLAR